MQKDCRNGQEAWNFFVDYVTSKMVGMGVPMNRNKVCMDSLYGAPTKVATFLQVWSTGTEA